MKVERVLSSPYQLVGAMMSRAVTLVHEAQTTPINVHLGHQPDSRWAGLVSMARTAPHTNRTTSGDRPNSSSMGSLVTTCYPSMLPLQLLPWPKGRKGRIRQGAGEDTRTSAKPY